MLITMTEAAWGTGRALLPFCQHVPDTPEVSAQFARYERGACTPRMARHILECNRDIDIRSLLSTVSVPTLVLHSARATRSTPARWGRYLAEHIPDARYVEHDADYHMTYRGARGLVHRRPRGVPHR